MRLLTKDVAEMVGLKEATIRRYRARGTFPEPDGNTYGHPWWYQETIKDWQVGRLNTKEWTEGKWAQLEDVEGGSNAP